MWNFRYSLSALLWFTMWVASSTVVAFACREYFRDKYINSTGYVYFDAENGRLICESEPLLWTIIDINSLKSIKSIPAFRGLQILAEPSAYKIAMEDAKTINIIDLNAEAITATVIGQFVPVYRSKIETIMFGAYTSGVCSLYDDRGKLIRSINISDKPRAVYLTADRLLNYSEQGVLTTCAVYSNNQCFINDAIGFEVLAFSPVNSIMVYGNHLQTLLYNLKTQSVRVLAEGVRCNRAYIQENTQTVLLAFDDMSLRKFSWEKGKPLSSKYFGSIDRIKFSETANCFLIGTGNSIVVVNMNLLPLFKYDCPECVLIGTSNDKIVIKNVLNGRVQILELSLKSGVKPFVPGYIRLNAFVALSVWILLMVWRLARPIWAVLCKLKR